MNNYKVLLSMKLVKNILTTFIDSFLVLYFLTVSKSNIIPLGMYHIIEVTMVFLTMFMLRNASKKSNRKNLVVLGIIFAFIYFLSIIILKDKIIEFAPIVGFLYGLSEGFYYSVFNSFETDGVKENDRKKFYGKYTIYKSLTSILFPIIFGSIITKTGFIKSLILVLIIVALEIFLSIIFKDENVPKSNKFSLKEYLKITKNNKVIKSLYKVDFCDGLTYSSGAFKLIVTIYIIKVFSNSFSLGIFTSIFSLVSCIIGYLFSTYIKKKKYIKILYISMVCTIISLCILLIKCNAITIIIFNLFQIISSTFKDLINESSKATISNMDILKDNYKVEYFLVADFCLLLGRFLSHTLFIMLAFVSEIFIIPIFIIFLVSLTINSANLQKVL